MKKFTILLVVCLFLFINYTNSQTWTNYTTADGLPGNDICSIAIDSQDNKWFSIFWEGLTKFDGTNWTTYPTGDIFNFIATDAMDNIWLAGVRNLKKFDGNNWTTYTPPEYNPSGWEIRDITIDKQGNIWLATDGIGVLRFDGTTWTNYPAKLESGPKGNEVHRLAIDAKGNKWFASNFCDGSTFFSTTPNYLTKFNDTTWTHYTTSELLCNITNALTTDSQGNVWLGTELGGVLKFDGTNWTNYTTTDGLSFNCIQVIAIDKHNCKWFADIGVTKFDGTAWINYNTSNGLAHNYVLDIAIDAQDNKWFATPGGVSKLSDASTEITTINENHLNLYPNPVQNVLHINLSGKTGELQVFDISGKCLLQKQITENESSVDVSCLENGIYFVKVIYDKKIFTEKIVKY
jgi:ligand-binding sensor domain-containing protein